MNSILSFLQATRRYISSLWSALLYTWCAESACMFLADVFLAFQTGVTGLGVISVWTDLAPTTFPACSLNHWRSCTVCVCMDVLHNSCSSSWCSWKALSSLDMRFHQRITQLLQENPPSSQCSAVPVLVYLTPYYKGSVGAHINDVEENYKGPTGSHVSAAVCGCDLVQVIYPSLCLVVVQDHLWFSVFSGAQDSIFVHGAHQQDIFPFLGAIGDDSGSVSEGKHWRCYRRVLHHKQLSGKLWLVFSHCPQHGNLSFQQFFTQGIWCEKIITCNVMTIQSFSHVKYHPHALIFFRCLPRGFTSVHLHIPGIAGSHAAHILIPYLAGLLGMYCLKGQRPRNATRHSSTVTWGPGL